MIKLKTNINNMTTLKVQPRATLYQTQIYSTNNGHRTMELPLGESHHGHEVDSNDVSQDMIEIPVPSTAPFTMKSTVVTVKYFVHVTLDIPHNIDLHMNLPVVVTNKCALRDATKSEDDQLDRPKVEKASKRRMKRMSSKNSTSSNADDD